MAKDKKRTSLPAIARYIIIIYTIGYLLCWLWKQGTSFQKSTAKVSNETKNWPYLPSKTCQRHFETRAASQWDLTKSCKRLGTHSKTKGKPWELRSILTSLQRRILTSHVVLYCVKRSHSGKLATLTVSYYEGFFKLLEALLQIHSCFFSHSIKPVPSPRS